MTLTHKQCALVLLGYGALSCLLFAPLLPSFLSAIPGGPVADVDGWQNVWNLWWVARAVGRGQDPFFTHMLFYPDGVALHLQTLNSSNGLLALPITALLGPIAGFNAALLLGFTLSGFFGFLLAYRVSGSLAGALIGGVVFACSPFHLTKAWDGQLEWIALQWLALYAYALLLALETGAARHALLAGLALALVGYTSWYVLLFVGIATALLAAIWLVRPSVPLGRWLLIRQLALVGGLGLLLLLPVLLPAIGARGGGEATPRGAIDDLVLIHSANLYDALLPSGIHPLWGAAVERLVRSWHPYIAAWNIALGYTALALAGVALLGAWRAAWRWGALLLAAWVLALGPLLQIGAWVTPIPLPYRALLWLPGVELARRPSHFIVIATLALAPLAALGARWLLERFASATARRATLAIIALLLAVELLPPSWQLHRLSVHPFFASAAATPGALLDLPPRPESSLPLEAQIVHGRPILGGFVSRPPDDPFVRQAPGVRALWAMQPDSTTLLRQPDDGLQALNASQIRTVTIDRAAVAPERRESLALAIAETMPDTAPIYRDAQLEAYAVPAVAPRPFAYFGGGWYDEERDGQRRWRWMGAAGEIVIVNPTQRARAVTLSLTAQTLASQAGPGERAVSMLVDGRAASGFSAAPQAAAHRFVLLVEPGSHIVRLISTTDREKGGVRQLSIVVTDARLQ